MHKTIYMQSIEKISMWEVFSSICPLKKKSSIGWRIKLNLIVQIYRLVLSARAYIDQEMTHPQLTVTYATKITMY